MYITTDLARLRERPPVYGGETHVDGPARPALLDLPFTADPARVVARYAVLRAVLMPPESSRDVAIHARSAADAHLGVTGGGWAEAGHLRALLDAGTPPDRDRLASAAAEAEATLDRHGAALLRRLAADAPSAESG